MPTYTIMLARASYQYAEVVVEGETAEAAGDEALSLAKVGDVDWTDGDDHDGANVIDMTEQPEQPSVPIVK